MTGTNERLEKIEMMIREACKFQSLQKDVIAHNQMSCILVALDEILDELKSDALPRIMRILDGRSTSGFA